MPNSPPVIDALRRLAGAGPDDVSDADLLARFVAANDALAFEALVRRHGGLVWGACRRRLRDEHAAEDAFQTTFLALARHAAGIRRPDTLGAWLHRVAVRCSAAFRRHARDPMAAPPPDAPALTPDPAAAAAGRDLERLIDAEVDALPEPFREAFILCEVQELTASAAARALGCPVGTVESRLTRARARLRERLSRRGVTAGALVGLGLAAAPAPSAAAAGAVAAATGATGAPAVWAVIADRAVGKGIAALGVGFVGGLAVVGLSGLVWTLAQSAERPAPAGPVAHSAAPVAAAIPEPEQFRRNRCNFPLPPEAIDRVGDPWLRHGALPQKLAFSADGRLLAAAGAGDRWLRVWDLTTGRPRMHLPLAPTEVPAAVALSADGATLRAVVHTGEEPRTAQLREYATYRAREVRRRPLPGGPAPTAVFDADGTHLAEARDGLVRVVSAATAAELWRTPVPPGTVDLAVCAAAGRVAVVPAGADRVRLLDLATGRPEGELTAPRARLSHPAFSADGRRLTALCAETQRVRVWDVPARGLADTIDPQASVVGLALRPDGEEVAVFASQCPIVRPVGPGAGPARPLCEGAGGVTGRFSPDGTLLAVATRTGLVRLLDAKTGRPHRPATDEPRAGPGEVDTPVPVAFSPDGRRLLVRGFQSWQEYTPDEERHPWVFVAGGRPDEPYLLAVEHRTAVSRERPLLARCTYEKKGGQSEFGIDLVNMATGAQVGRIELDGRAHHPAFSPDGKTLYAVVARVLRGWDVRTGREVMRGTGGAGEVVYRVIVSADGRYVATADNVLTDAQRENAIQVWDASTGEVVLAADGCQRRPHIAFSPDGRRFAAVTPANEPAGSPELRVWDLPTLQVVAAVRGYDGQPAFSPDGRSMAVTHKDAVVLLELATHQARHVFRHHGPVEPAVVWRPDGRVLAAASSEAPVYLWDVAGDRTGDAPEWKPAGDADRWAALTGDDAAAAFGALRQLWAHPAKAVPFLTARVGAGPAARLAARACEALELIGTADAKQVLAGWARGDSESPLAKESKDSLRRLSAVAN